MRDAYFLNLSLGIFSKYLKKNVNVIVTINLTTFSVVMVLYMIYLLKNTRLCEIPDMVSFPKLLYTQ